MIRCKHCNKELYQTKLWGGMDYIWAAVDRTRCTSNRHKPQTEAEKVDRILSKYE